MSDEDMPRGWGRMIPSKARVFGLAVRAAFPRGSEKSQVEAGKASAAAAVGVDRHARSSEDVEAFGTADEDARAKRFAAKGKTPPERSSRDIEHAGIVTGEPGDVAAPEADARAEIGDETSRSSESAATTPTAPNVIREKEVVEPDPTVAAFFDVDNTLIQGASVLLLARGLAKHKFFTSGDLARMAWQQAKFRVSGRESMSDVSSGRERALGFVKGRSTAELDELCREIFDESITDKFWPGTKALAQMHIDAGQQVWLVTATPVELAAVIADRLGLTGALGTVAEHVDGVYTGRLVGDILHGPGKAYAVAELAAQKKFDLEKCYAYSDSSNDLPMLELVGNPVAVNPDSKLRDAARKNGWQIKDYRTMRKAAKIGLQGTAAAAAAGGAFAVWRRR